MALKDQRHAVRFPVPDLLVRGRASTVYAPVYLDGALVAPSAATVSVFDASNTPIVDEAAGTISGDIAEYTISAGTLPDTLALEMGWRIEWTLTLAAAVAPDGVIAAVNDAALVRRVLNCPISDVDLFRRVPSIDPASSNVIHTMTTVQSYIDEAHTRIQNQLIRKGNRPNLIMSPADLRELYVLESIALIYDNFATRLNPAFSDLADRYRADARREWSALQFLYDTDDDGQADSPGRRRAGTPTIWLSGRGRSGQGWRY